MTTDIEQQLGYELSAAANRIQPSTPDAEALRNRVAAEPAPTRAPRRWLLPAATAAAVVTAVSVPAVLSAGNHSRSVLPGMAVKTGAPTSAPGIGTVLAPAPPSTGRVMTHSTAPAAPHSTGVTPPRPPDCIGEQLRLSVLMAGPADGTQNIFFGLRNVSRNPCWLDGVPTLYGANSDGSTTLLPFHSTADASIVGQSSPGSLSPQAYGQFLANAGLNNCTRPMRTYPTLMVRLASGAQLTMPFPRDAFVTGCYGNVGTAGTDRP